MYVNVTKLSQVTRGITPRLSSGRFPELLKFRLNLATLECQSVRVSKVGLVSITCPPWRLGEGGNQTCPVSSKPGLLKATEAFANTKFAIDGLAIMCVRFVVATAMFAVFAPKMGAATVVFTAFHSLVF